MRKTLLLIPFIRLLLTDTRAFLKALYHFTVIRDARRRVIRSYGLADGLPSVDLLDLVPDLDQEVHDYTYLEGTSRTIDIAFIKAMCAQRRGCRYLEIGSWRGESLKNAAEVSDECYSVSLSDDEMRAAGFHKEIAFQRLFSKNLPNVHHIAQSSLTFDFESLQKKFDVIFIDGDHSYEAVKKDTETSFRLLKDDSSVIIWHDNGIETPNWPVVAGILDGSPPEALSHLYSVTNTLCAIYYRGEIRSELLPAPQTPNKVFSVHVVARGMDAAPATLQQAG